MIKAPLSPSIATTSIKICPTFSAICFLAEKALDPIYEVGSPHELGDSSERIFAFPKNFSFECEEATIGGVL